MIKLIDECNRKGIALIVGIDSKAHSGLWNSLDTNDRGRKLEEIFMTKGLIVA